MSVTEAQHTDPTGTLVHTTGTVVAESRQQRRGGAVSDPGPEEGGTHTHHAPASWPWPENTGILAGPQVTSSAQSPGTHDLGRLQPPSTPKLSSCARGVAIPTIRASTVVREATSIHSKQRKFCVGYAIPTKMDQTQVLKIHLALTHPQLSIKSISEFPNQESCLRISREETRQKKLHLPDGERGERVETEFLSNTYFSH